MNLNALGDQGLSIIPNRILARGLPITRPPTLHKGLVTQTAHAEIMLNSMFLLISVCFFPLFCVPAIADFAHLTGAFNGLDLTSCSFVYFVET
jgi:hypothetical protein